MDCLHHVCLLNRIRSLQVRNGASYFQNSIIGPGRKTQLLHRLFQQA